MSTELDLDAYFERIRWGAATTPDYATLAGLLAAHMAHIPFENLDVLLGRGIRIDLPSVARKLVGSRRGGYCFEHCTLFAAVLERLGFAPVRQSARVLLHVSRDQAPRTHMFLTVAVREGTFVVDPGFGALAPKVPVPLAEGVEAAEGGVTHFMSRDEGDWVLRARIADRVIDCWFTPLDRVNAIDFVMGNHFTASHPASNFVNRLMLRALTPEGRVGVMNRDVTVWTGARSESYVLKDRGALRDLLRAHFGFDLPEVDALRIPTVPDWD